jgi:lathosterol oxidase
VAPVEALATFWPVVLLTLPAAPVWAHAYALWTAGFVALNLYLHAGYESAPVEALLRGVGLNSSAFHNIHHAATVRNFGELCYIWDALLGTGAHPEKGAAGKEVTPAHGG